MPAQLYVILKQLLYLLLLLVNAAGVRAQLTAEQRIEASVIGWWSNNKYDHRRCQKHKSVHQQYRGVGLLINYIWGARLPMRTPLKHIVWYGLLLAALVFVLKWLQWRFMILDHAIELYVGLIAVFFTALGIWLATHLIRPKTVTVEKEIVITVPGTAMVDTAEREKLQLSTREGEVLDLLVKGYSNAEIAAALFVSLSTVKTHVSNILFKMGVKSRAQVIEKANRLKITR